MPHPVSHKLDAVGPLDFLWLELTNGCNLACKHCYAESGPGADTDDVLGVEKWLELIDEARELGCRQVQFIGGEPTLCRDLPRLCTMLSTADSSILRSSRI